MVSYVLPFKAADIFIWQGYNGKFSHFETPLADYRFALDFMLTEGTPVVASREGIVHLDWDLSENCYRGIDYNVGKDYLGNFLVIDHGDGSFALYQHLKRGSISCRKGDLVQQGEEIARTGLTGWVGPVPHLHFMIYKRDPRLRSIPVRIKGV